MLVDIDDISVEHHATDGFTLSIMRRGYRVKKRFIGYSVDEAKEIFISFVNELGD